MFARLLDEIWVKLADKKNGATPNLCSLGFSGFALLFPSIKCFTRRRTRQRVVEHLILWMRRVRQKTNLTSLKKSSIRTEGEGGPWWERGIMMCCPRYSWSLIMGVKVSVCNALFFGSLPIFGSNRVLTCREPNSDALGSESKPTFAFWLFGPHQSSHELSHHPKPTRLSDETLQGLIKTAQTTVKAP